MKDDPERSTPAGFARYAREFFDCACAADEKVGSRPEFIDIAPVPVMYLMGQSIELILKAHLLHNGDSLGACRDYGHDLEKCLYRANELGLSDHLALEAGELHALHCLNVLYEDKQLNYLVTGTKRFPMLGPVWTGASKLLDTIGPMVGYR